MSFRAFFAGLYGQYALLISLAIVLNQSFTIALLDKSAFEFIFAVEDGPIEYGTALLLAFAAIPLFAFANGFRKHSNLPKMTLMIVYGVIFLLAAGEEISWGQRIIGWETTEFFTANNFQNETNLHNLVAGGTHLAKTVFGHALSIAILLYLVGLPFAYGKWRAFDGFINAMAIPVPQLTHAAAAVISSLVIQFIDAPRKWEVYELAFGIIALAIFLLPQNVASLTRGTRNTAHPTSPISKNAHP